MANMKKNTIIAKPKKEIIISEIIEHIDNENIKIVCSRNNEVLEVRNYIIRTQYENERNRLEQQIQILSKQIFENGTLRQLLEERIKKLTDDNRILEEQVKKLTDEKTILENRIKELEEQVKLRMAM